MTLRVQILKDKFNQSLGLPFQELLPYSAIEKALWELKIKYKKRLFDPIVTLWAFLSQVLDTDKSCHNAVSKIIAYLTGEGVEIPSLRDAPRTTDTSAYCQARSRLPEKLLKNLLMWSAGNSYGTPPLRLSLQGTRHHLNNFIPQLLAAHNTKRLEIYRTLLKVIVHKTVSDLLKAAALRYRPGRSEPRVRKRRPKAYPLMTKPRRELRKQLQTA
ncbi:hypothetical protein NIES2107_08820 [Nostoc carneum NIES-2107]|nr:hypothetical protein NIES2107_08820 [Nostoc carneum NIES-2107]